MHANLTQMHQVVRVTFPAISVLFTEEQNWVGTPEKSNLDCMPTVVDEEQNPSDGSQARVSCEAPIARCGSERNGVSPKEAEPPLRVLGEGYFAPTGRTSALDLNDGVSAFEFPTEEYRGTALGFPYRRDASTPSLYDRKLQLYCNRDVR